ncbi:hypothetical protein J6590_042266 [Homalodisca vitripennis]|nr:hypothetical protein J6590_042266 [Homalodisca vitripennis]
MGPFRECLELLQAIGARYRYSVAGNFTLVALTVGNTAALEDQLLFRISCAGAGMTWPAVRYIVIDSLPVLHKSRRSRGRDLCRWQWPWLSCTASTIGIHVAAPVPSQCLLKFFAFPESTLYTSRKSFSLPDY